MRSLESSSTSSLVYGFNAADYSPSDHSSDTYRKDSYIYLGTTSSHQKSDKPRKKTRSERLEIRYKSQEKLVELHREIGETKTAESMSKCGEKFETLTCGDHIVAKLPTHRCNIRYCALCANRRAARYQKKYLFFAQEFVKQSSVTLTPCLLTLTQKKLEGERLVDSRNRILKSWNNFIRHDFFSVYFAGGFYTIENTISETGNHTHLHVVVFRRKFVSEKLLKERWAIVSHGAKNLNIKRIDKLELGLREAIKYVSKPIDVHKFEKKHLLELLEIKGKRMIGAFGEFGKFCSVNKQPKSEEIEREKLAEGQPCSHCHEELFRIMMTGEDLVAFYRRVEQSGRGSPVSLEGSTRALELVS